MIHLKQVKPEDHPDFVGGIAWSKMEIQWIEKLRAEAVQAEREACAKVCESMHDEDRPSDYAYAIRARSKT